MAAGAGLAAVALGTVVGCEPGGLSSAMVAYTLDKTATHELKQQHVGVSWLTCTGSFTTGFGNDGAQSKAKNVVSVNCQGQTTDRRRITVTGRVTRAVDGVCVRGDLTAKVGGKQVFRVDGLGNCNATPHVTYKPPAAYHPSYSYRQPGPTVTVTRTVWCKGDPTCWPAQGK
ncbi:hypothetical protein J2Z21_003588 [Streptomyces griseochromogenes]|uniref:Uncharacterized protein n=1 Tax=Streptomyces griseochromogenes TaxID=68214 RepID=A0A1B1B847_9ACTN|nr:hypothetical protein [Streptomyces griseochromogenes]ANP54963.1 hypothetical protein AVL59_40045 [Streptomyces griseochromogenes]MBP2050649.1 hypothetical protein [Streptomyces griseochromogenes]